LSNIIKLRRTVDRVCIEHSLSNLRGISSSPDGALGEQNQAGLPGSYVPLVDEYHRGFEAGRVEAEKEFNGELDRRLSEERKRVDVLMTSIQSQLLLLHARWEKLVMQLALSVAKVILRREVSVDREIVLGQVREALRHLVGVERVKMRVNPCDEEALRLHRAEVFSVSDALRDMVIEADEKIGPGGCIIESDSGNVDARIEAQLGRLETLLFEQAKGETRS
jgi:flagellar assembly protein FliH